MSPEGRDSPGACSQSPGEAPCWLAGPAWQLLLQYHPHLQRMARQNEAFIPPVTLRLNSMSSTGNQPSYNVLLVQSWVSIKSSYLFSISFYRILSKCFWKCGPPTTCIKLPVILSKWRVGSEVSIFNKNLRWFSFILNVRNPFPVHSSECCSCLLGIRYFSGHWKR